MCAHLKSVTGVTRDFKITKTSRIGYSIRHPQPKYPRKPEEKRKEQHQQDRVNQHIGKIERMHESEDHGGYEKSKSAESHR